jgi:hypothetical protein
VALDRTIFFQSGSSKTQSVIEAVANSVDALGGSIGQFGMGVKQILAWLNDGEHVEVFSKKQGQSPHRLIIMRQSGGFRISIMPCLLTDFQKAIGMPSEQGTAINVVKNQEIPENGEGITLNSLQQTIHSKFAYAKWTNIWMRVGSFELRRVNGWEHRTILAGLGNWAPVSPPEAGQIGPTIVVSLEPRILRMVDNGSGMDFQVLSRMFLPVDGGDKENKVLTTAEEMDTEANHLGLVHAIVKAADLPSSLPETARLSCVWIWERGGLIRSCRDSLWWIWAA